MQIKRKLNALFIYRLYKHKLDNLACVIPELDEGNVCPACPKVKLYVCDYFKITAHVKAGGKLIK